MFRSLALKFGSNGNDLVMNGQYYEAIDNFNNAIKYNPYDYRFYLNRAYCYEKIELFHLALADTEAAIYLKPDITKCHYRKSKALSGLRLFTQAEDALKRVLKLEPDCKEAHEELNMVRVAGLMDLGFDEDISNEAAKTYDSISEATESLLSQVLVANSFLNFGMKEDLEDLNGEIVENELEKSVTNNFSQTPEKTKLSSQTCETYASKLLGKCASDKEEKEQTKMTSPAKYADKARKLAKVLKSNNGLLPRSTIKVHNPRRPTNIWNYNGLRVENVTIDCSKAMLQKVFSKYGKVKGIEKIRHTKTSVWVFYDNPFSPIEAITDLQGHTVKDVSCFNQLLKLYFAPTNEQPELKFSRPKQPRDNKGECYYWRTTYCSSEAKCRLLHIPVNKHIDAQIWMKTKENKLNNLSN